ncbi:hypothetical protein V1514DRAFT_294777 [Lipomyces japonicus]|uniref:uncharacterized protein n=1 Tax=Lipomyces japonicus TaxID=56871 RepID=UPI0034CF5865
MSALTLDRRKASSASDTGLTSDGEVGSSDYPSDSSRPSSRRQSRGRSLRSAYSSDLENTRSISADSSIFSIRSLSRNSSTTSFFSRFRRFSASTSGSTEGPSSPTDAHDDLALTLNFKSRTFNRRRARTLETIPQNATADHRRPTLVSESASSLPPARPRSIMTPGLENNGGGSENASPAAGHLFQRRNVQDLSRSRVTFEEPEHPLHESMSSLGVRSRPSSIISEETLPQVSTSGDIIAGYQAARRPRSLMSSLSENEFHLREERVSASAPISPRSIDIPQPAFAIAPISRSVSPTPSSSSSSSNNKPLSKLRKRVQSAFFFSTTSSHKNHHASSSSSSIAGDVPASPPFLSTYHSGTSSPITRSLSNHSESSTARIASPFAKGRQRSQTLSSLEESRARKEFTTASSLTNILALKFRSGSEPNFLSMKSNLIRNMPRQTASPEEHQLPLALIEAHLPSPEDNESPDEYLKRIEKSFSQSQIPAMLARSGDDFYQSVMRIFCSRFEFTDEPIDMSLRKFLLNAELPKETQQIDRVLDAFSKRYHHCNLDLFESSEQAFFITFSMVMLHTDVFNKSNKHKMQKSDYVRNTTWSPSISKVILEYFYDNVIYTPFILSEADQEPISNDKSQLLLKHRKSLGFARSAKEPADPYALLMDGQIYELRPVYPDILIREDPYSYAGTAPQFDVKVLQVEFLAGPLVKVVPARTRQSTIMSFDIGPIHTPLSYSLKIAKVGILTSLERKKKRSSNKSSWRTWGVILTLSNAYFFKDVSWIRGLMEQLHSASSGDCVFLPPLYGFHADEVMTTDNMIGLLDHSYTRRPNAFVITAKDGAQDWFIAESESEMNDWIAKVNYAAALSTTGVNLRGHIDEYKNIFQPFVIAESDEKQISLNPLVVEDGILSDSNNDLLSSAEKIWFDHALKVSEKRCFVMEEKVKSLEEELFSQTKGLENDYRTAKHISVLTPIGPKTRESLILAAGMTSAKIDWLRIEVMRTRCYREILVKEIDSEKELSTFLKKKIAAAIPHSAVRVTDPEKRENIVV